MEGNLASKILSKFNANENDRNFFKKKTTTRNLEDDLPDGSCFSRVLKIESQLEFNCESTIKKCEVSILFNVKPHYYEYFFLCNCSVIDIIGKLQFKGH